MYTYYVPCIFDSMIIHSGPSQGDKCPQCGNYKFQPPYCTCGPDIDFVFKLN